MFWYDFSFRSLTAAQDGRSVLEHAGIGAELLRAPQRFPSRAAAMW